MPVTVIIPAHNESSVIVDCLRTLTDGAREGELEVIVVCNGCTDDTADRARSVGSPVKVIETDVPSKCNALNLGDDAARYFPRFYVDADVCLPLESVRQVGAVLEDGLYLAAAPRMEVDLRQRGWSVRAYYHVWLSLPYCRDAMIGSGVYALSEAGRKRFGRFPETKADDTFVRLLFTPAERSTVDGCTFTVAPPTTLGSVVKIKARSHFGTRELRQQYPGLFRNESSHKRALASMLAKRPSIWPELTVYGYVKVMTRLRSYWKRHFGDQTKWERDETTRVAIVPAPGR